MQFNKIESVEATVDGHQFLIEGVHDGREFSINLWVEYEGRDVDCWPVRANGYNPMDVDHDFFNELCKEDKFQELYNKAYQELMS